MPMFYKTLDPGEITHPMFSQITRSNSERIIKLGLRASGPAKARPLQTALLFYFIAAAIPGANGATVQSCNYTLDEEMTVYVSEALCPAGITLTPGNTSECQVWMWQASDSDSKPVLFAEVSLSLSLLFNISNVPEEAKQGLVIICRSYSHQILGPVTFVITEEGVSSTPTSSPPSVFPPQTSPTASSSTSPTASSSTSPTPAATLPTPTKSTPSWLIIVIVIILSAIAASAIAAVIIGIVCCYKRRQRRKRNHTHQTENHSTDNSVPVPLQPTTPISLPPRSMYPQLPPTTSTEPVLASTPTENVQEDVSSPENSFSFSEEVSSTGNDTSETVSDIPTPRRRTHPRSRGNTREILTEAEEESHSINTSPQTFTSCAGDSAINIEDLGVCETSPPDNHLSH